jgi:hypothetical protein
VTSFGQTTDLPSGQDEAAHQQTALAQATDLIRGALGGQTIVRVDDDTVVLPSPGRRLLQLPQAPIVSVTSVTSVAIGSATFTEGTDYEVDGELNALARLGYSWPRGGLVRVTYTHGYDTVPEELARLCGRIADQLLDGTLGARSVQESIGTKQTSVTFHSLALAGGDSVFALADLRMLDGYRLPLLP